MMHSETLGDALCDRGLKAGITNRPEGYEDRLCLDQPRAPLSDRSQICDSRFVYWYDLYFGTPDNIGISGNSIALTNGSSEETTRNGLIDYSYFDYEGGSGTGHGFYDVQLTGYDLVCYNNSRHNPSSGAKCRDSLDPASIPDGYYNMAIGTADDFAKPTAPLAPGLY